jgi:hypothetical protein
MERLQKKLSIDSILGDRDLMLLVLLAVVLLYEKADLPLLLALAYIFFF